MHELHVQQDAISLLNSLVDLVQTPERIRQAHECVRQEMQLTEAQKEKHTKAIELIEKYEVLDTELKNRAATLLNFHETLQNLSASLDDRQLVVKNAEDSISIRTANQAEIDKRRLDEKREFETERMLFKNHMTTCQSEIDALKSNLAEEVRKIMVERQGIKDLEGILHVQINKVKQRDGL